MIELGKKQLLEVVRKKEFGVYVAEKQEMRSLYCFQRNRSPRRLRLETSWRFSFIKILKTA